MNNPLDTLSIDTPETVSFSYEVAGIGSRFLAALVDTALIGLLQVIVIGTIVLVLLQSSNPLSEEEPALWIIAVLAFISFVFLWGYYIFFEATWNGQTPGKRWIGLRVIRTDGTPVTLSEVVIRNLVRTLDLLPTGYGVGVITMFVTANSCRLGDLAAKTVVVYDRPASLSQAPLRNTAAPWTSQAKQLVPDGFPLEKLTDQDMQTLEAFLSRRNELANHQQLASYLLRSLYSRLGLAGLDADFEADPERALAVIHQAKRDLEATERSTGGG